jgi:hypothetical protein
VLDQLLVRIRRRRLRRHRQTLVVAIVAPHDLARRRLRHARQLIRCPPHRQIPLSLTRRTNRLKKCVPKCIRDEK